MVQIPQGKGLRVLSILERVGANGEDEVWIRSTCINTQHCCV